MGFGTTSVRTSGPIFNGSFASEMHRCVEELDQEIGDEAVERIQDRLDVVLKNPTGFYRSHIRAHPRGQVVVVDDSDVVYGPWLEGVSSRNQTTRFKGYYTFRRVSEEMQRDVPEILRRIVTKYVERLG
jgi:hypothetical protein